MEKDLKRDFLKDAFVAVATAVATGVAAYALQREAKLQKKYPSLSNEDAHKLRVDWAKRAGAEAFSQTFRSLLNRRKVEMALDLGSFKR